MCYSFQKKNRKDAEKRLKGPDRKQVQLTKIKTRRVINTVITRLYNELDHNELDHNELDHNELDHNKLSYKKTWL